MTSTEATRVETDVLGSIELPADALIGINTVRSLENFNVSGRRLGSSRPLVSSLAAVKGAAARANAEVGALEEDKAAAIIAACAELRQGAHEEHLVCDILEGSGGTSVNMNMNEVIANLALRRLGRHPGDYGAVHPNDHVNLSQSTNDVVPTAVRLAVHEAVKVAILAFVGLAEALDAKATSFADVLRLGRTCLQDAQPMTLGQAFGGYSAAVRRHANHLSTLNDAMLVVPLGGTAVGTGFGVRGGYREAVLRHLRHILGLPVSAAEDAFDAMQNADDLARISAELKVAANTLWKIGNDLILLSSGPAGGLGELRLPAVQVGSSLMPGKVNPVLPMTLCQVALAVNGNDLTVSLAAQQGLLDLNHYELIIGDRLLDSALMLAGTLAAFTSRCILDIEADAQRSWRHLTESSALATVLVPALGYAKVSELVRGASANGDTFLNHALQRGLLSEGDIRDAFAKAATSPDEL